MKTRAFFLMAIVLAVSEARAEMLLVEFRHTGIYPPTGVPSAAMMNFQIGSPGNDGGGFAGSYTTGDVGQVNTATPEALTIMQIAADSPSGWFYSEVFGWPPGHRYTGSLDELWTFSEMGGDGISAQSTAYVEQLGDGFAGYELTRVTQTIERIEWTPNDADPRLVDGSATQLISLYGEVAPTYPPLVGDYNEDGTVDTADYATWRMAMAINAELPPGEWPDMPNTFNGPRPAAELDYVFWRSHYGQSVAPLGAALVPAAVPEPATWLFALCAGAVHVVTRRFRSERRSACRYWSRRCTQSR